LTTQIPRYFLLYLCFLTSAPGALVSIFLKRIIGTVAWPPNPSTYISSKTSQEPICRSTPHIYLMSAPYDHPHNVHYQYLLNPKATPRPQPLQYLCLCPNQSFPRATVLVPSFSTMLFLRSYTLQIMGLSILDPTNRSSALLGIITDLSTKLTWKWGKLHIY
jgi:hypothetical protein